jgi:DMSO/TMAO reductase YedYZ molybdopterin-dependent catalytic subunit
VGAVKRRQIAGFSVVAVIVIAFIVGVVVFGPDSGDVELLEGTEVREYKGENLSSINDFRQNAIKGTQYIDEETYMLEVTGLVANPVSYTYDQVLDDFDSYQKVVRLNCVEGWAVNLLWEGVLVRDVIEEASPLPEVNTVIFHAYDGYTTSFPIQYVLDNDILMAHKMNNLTIPPERGFPFQLVAESKWGYKWIKWITRIEFSDDADYEGFWESRGYSNIGDLESSFFD